MGKKPNPTKKTTKKSSARPAKAGPAKKTEPEAASVPVIATVRSLDALNQLPALAEKLADEGMEVNQVMLLSGVISGSCPADKIAALNAKVPDVVIEPEMKGFTPS